MAKRWPERAPETRQYDLLPPNVRQKEPPRVGSTISYSQTWPERGTKTRQYDLLRPRIGQKKAPRLGSTICCGQELARRATETRQYDLLRSYGQELARSSLQDSAVRFVAAKSWAERATETPQYDLLRARVGQKEPPKLGCSSFLRPRVGQKARLGSSICYGQTWARKSHQDSAVRFVTPKSWSETLRETRQYDLLRPRVGQKEPPRLGSTICYGQTWARKSHRESAVRFVTANRGPEGATETRQYDLLRPNVGQKEPPRLGSTICYGQMWASKSHQDSAARFVAVKRGPERATKTRQYDLLRPRLGQKEPPRLGSTICYGQTWARKSHRDSAARFVTTKSWPERVTETRQYDLLRPNMGQKEPPRLGSTVCYGQELATKTRQYGFCGLKWARKSHRDSSVRFATAKSWPERGTKTRQDDLLRPRVGQKEPPRLRSTICQRQELVRKSHRETRQ